MSSVIGPKGNMSGWSPYFKVYDPLKAGSIDGTDLIPHDNAVVRAMSAEYNPPDERTITSNPVLTLFVGRLNFKTSERQLKDEFSQYGQVKSCRLVRDIITGMSRGYGFVEFRKESDAQRAWKAAHGSVFHERQILVEWEFSRTMPGWIPRRLGGGLGGKKESGQLRFGGRDRPFRRPLILPAEPDSSLLSADHEHHSKVHDSSEDFRGESSRGKYSRQDRPMFRKEFEKQSKSVSDDKRECKTYSDKQLAVDIVYKDFPDKKFNEDNRKYKDWSSNKAYYPEDRRKYKNDFYEDSCHDEGRQKYRQKAEDKFHQVYQDDERKYKRSSENSYNAISVRKYERENSYKTSYRAESKNYKTKEDTRYSEHLDYKQNSTRESNDDYDDYCNYYDYREETNGRYSHKKFKDDSYFEFDGYYSQKHSGSFVSSKYDREMYEEREKPSRKDLSTGPSSSKSISSRNEGPDSSQATETHSKRKYRSSSVSSLSSCSRSSSKKKHKKKHKKRSKQTDSSEDEISSSETKKHKKSKKKKSKKSKKAMKDDSEID